MSDLERIEAAMEEKVRPALRSHGGDISIDHVEGKTVYVKLLGQCAGCPSADLTNETIVEAELKAALPDLVEKAVVVQTCLLYTSCASPHGPWGPPARCSALFSETRPRCPGRWWSCRCRDRRSAG